jgi:phosphate transport system substrate-binding protein
MTSRHRCQAPWTRRRAAAVLALALALAFAACGTDDNGPKATATDSTDTTAAAAAAVQCATGTITGAGSTFVQTLAQQWIKDYGNACPGATINYQGVGSGAGVQQFVAGTVDLAGSDAVLKPEEEAAAKAIGQKTGQGDVINVPWATGGIAVLYNLPGVKDLHLSPKALAGIFAGTVKTWDAPEIAADNKGAELPSLAIQVIHRSDGSGTTKVFTSYLTAVAPDVWKAGADKDVAWPTGQGAKGSDGVSVAVKQAEGAIGYAELSFATANGLPVALLQNPAGKFVGPTPAAVTAAIREAEVPANLQVKVTFTPKDPAAYPISTTTWAILFAKPADAAKAKLLKGFLLYALGAGQASATKLSYAPLPQELVVRAQAAVYALPG